MCVDEYFFNTHTTQAPAVSRWRVGRAVWGMPCAGQQAKKESGGNVFVRGASTHAERMRAAGRVKRAGQHQELMRTGQRDAVTRKFQVASSAGDSTR
jgi:hypothetical protein